MIAHEKRSISNFTKHHCIPSKWEFFEEAGVELEQCRAEGMVEGERHFFQLLEMGAASELLSVLVVMRAEQDEVRDDVEGVALAKQGLKQALAKATMEATDLLLQKLSTEASIQRLSDQVAHAQEETSRLLFELSAVRSERDEVVNSAEAAKEEVS
ncbi:hypothetical protein ACLOJK_019991 [Asimina triloba]